MDNTIDRDRLTKDIIVSQHCQRNWDISKSIPDSDVDVLLHSITNCPSKQNHAFYKVYAITNREIIEQIHENTNGFGFEDEGEFVVTTNPQTLANLVLVFEVISPSNLSEEHATKNEKYESGSVATASKDTDQAIGVAAGYASLTSQLLGYRSGCCGCFDGDNIKKLIDPENKNPETYPALLMGIGFPDTNKPRREHHVTGKMIPSHKKEEIEIVRI